MVTPPAWYGNTGICQRTHTAHLMCMQGFDLPSVGGKVTGEVTGESITQNVEVVFDRQCAKHGLSKVSLSEYPDQGSELTALSVGRIAFVMDGAPAANYFLQHAPAHLTELQETSWPKTYVGPSSARPNHSSLRRGLPPLTRSFAMEATAGLCRSGGYHP